jgi:hypothetical protein
MDNSRTPTLLRSSGVLSVGGRTRALHKSRNKTTLKRNRHSQPTIHNKHGWKIISVRGSPKTRGITHGKLLYKELRQVVRYLPFLVKVEFNTTITEYINRCSTLFHQLLKTKYQEYYEELEGIHIGAKSKGVDITVDMLISWNAFLSMYGEYKKGSSENVNDATPVARCSAFIATGTSTEKGDIVMAHNTHCNYALATLSNIIIYAYPDKGHSFCMQTCAGLLCSSMDWFVCDNGMVGCETTIFGIKYKPKFGAPYFCRIRDCMQYRDSLDDYAETMMHNNSGDYACSWLFGDTRTGEIMLFELGLKRHSIQKTKDGAFYGMNSAMDDTLRRLETTDTFHDNIQNSMGARSARLEHLLFTEYKGKINLTNAKRILADHYDVFLDRTHRGIRTICKHTDLAKDTMMKKPYYPHGAIDGKVINSEMAKRMSFYGKFGSSCDREFNKGKYLAKHPEYAEWREYLKNMPNKPWTQISPISITP